jgi:hypothetical protein
MTTIARYFTHGHMRGVSCRVWDQIRVRGNGLGRHHDTTEGIPNRSFIPHVSRRVACLSQIVPARKSSGRCRLTVIDGICELPCWTRRQTTLTLVRRRASSPVSWAWRASCEIALVEEHFHRNLRSLLAYSSVESIVCECFGGFGRAEEGYRDARWALAWA